MFLPLTDKNPLRIIPFEYVNVGLIAINVFVFVVFQSGLLFSLDEELQLLAWADENVTDGYVDWYEFDHPQLGAVELGGWNSAGLFVNPPAHLLEAEVAPHTDLAIFQALCAPALRHRETIVESAGDGAWRIRVVGSLSLIHI